VPCHTPARIGADLQLLTVLQRLLVCAQPLEGCALLLGERCGTTWWLRRVWPCCNVWPQAEQRCSRFAIDPREQLLAQKWGRQRGLELLGSAHSHPTSAAVPSATDCRLTAAPALMLIHGGAPAAADGEGTALVPWWIPEPPAQPQRLPWTRLPWTMES
jgi:proteasome lid subunit RPN8/RPN11